MTRDGNGGLADYVGFKSASDLCLVTVLGLDFGIPAEMTALWVSIKAFSFLRITKMTTIETNR